MVIATASEIAQSECGPAPNTIGIGPTNTTVPKLTGLPERVIAIITKTIPTKIKRKPRRNSLCGDGQRMPLDGRVSRLTGP